MMKTTVHAANSADHAGSVACLFTCGCGRVRVITVDSMTAPTTDIVPRDWLVTETRGAGVTSVICNHCQTPEQKKLVKEVQDRG